MRYVVDVGALLLLAVNLLLGWRFGIIGRCISLVGVYLGVLAATYVGNPVQQFFTGHGRPTNLYDAGWSYAGIFVLVVLMFEIIAALYRDRMRTLISLIFDRTAGAIGGVGIAILEFGVLCLVLLAVGDAAVHPGQNLPGDRNRASNAVRASFLGQPVSGISGGIRELFKGASSTNLPDHLAEQTSQ